MSEDKNNSTPDENMNTNENAEHQAQGAATGGAEQEAEFDPSLTGDCKHGLPQVTFSTFILSLSSSALVHLGEVPEPETGEVKPNLPLAKHTIDILAMLKCKTKNCLDEDEKRLLEGILYELRMKYVMKKP